MKRLRDWLDGIPFRDPIERQQAGVFQWVLIGWIILETIYLLIVIPPFFLPPPPETAVPPSESIPPIFFVLLWLSVIASLLLFIVPVIALVVLRRGRFKRAVTIATLGLLLTQSFATYNLGITNPTIQIVFQIPIALAGLLAGRRLLLTVCGLSLTVFITVAILESFSPPLAGFFAVIPNPDGTVSSPLDGGTGLTVGFFVAVTILLTFLLDRFSSALRLALTRALEHKEELRIIRASLEKTVIERTSALQTALEEVQTRAAEQAKLFEEIEAQRATIRDLSVPVIPINPTTRDTHDIHPR